MEWFLLNMNSKIYTFEYISLIPFIYQLPLYYHNDEICEYWWGLGDLIMKSWDWLGLTVMEQELFKPESCWVWLGLESSISWAGAEQSWSIIKMLNLTSQPVIPYNSHHCLSNNLTQNQTNKLFDILASCLQMIRTRFIIIHTLQDNSSLVALKYIIKLNYKVFETKLLRAGA